MISGISIKDFAIVKELNVDLKPGLNIITGETGAGKSVIIEAVSMALGSRADTAYVRSGCEKAIVTLLVDFEGDSLDPVLDEIGVPNDNPIVIRREISSQSKSICRINGTIVPLSALNILCKKIADIHGQYDQQILLDSENHLDILDLYGGSELKEALDKTSKSYEDFASFSSEYYKLKKDLSDSERRRDFLKYELEEIKKANVKIGEDEELEENIRIMENGEKLYEAVSSAHSSIFGSDFSAESALGNALSNLESVKGISSDIDELITRISNAYYELEDVNSELRNLRDSVSFSQNELDDAIERLELINKLKRKYGGSVESVLNYLAEAEKSLSDIDNADDKLKELEKRIKESKDIYDKDADALSAIRKSAAVKLENLVDKELAELNFNNAYFKVKFETTASSAKGKEKVEFLISTNRGEDAKPLARIASGGELSRIMLALKSIIGEIDNIPTLIFDEIDTGISGATAAVVGEKLEKIAKSHQVICITHLPQIACKGESHLRIEKVSDEISTHTTVVPLNKDERVEELARLLSGATISESARMQARELLGIK